MKFDCIIANSPFGKIGTEIVKKLINEIDYKDISILGTRAMLGKHNEHLALEYVYIEDYILETHTECKWVKQIIILGHRGSCKVIPSTCYQHNVETKSNELRITFTLVFGGLMHQSVGSLLTRNRATSMILSVSDEDYEYIKEHWGEMDYIERFWWMHDHGLYKRFIEQ